MCGDAPGFLDDTIESAPDRNVFCEIRRAERQRAGKAASVCYEEDARAHRAA
jgi:hypothetical protein